MQGLFNIAAAIVGALIGSWVGVILTNSKVQRERGFDRQLQWCESMMGALNDAGAAVTSASTGLDADGREDCWTEVITLYERLIPLSGQKEMYAPKEAVTLIQTFMSKLSALIESHLKAHDTDGPTIDCEDCLGDLRKAAGSLAKIARDHLGLPALSCVTTQQNDRFLGSFRGRRLGRHQAAFR